MSEVVTYKATDIRKDFSGVHVLNGIDFEVEPGTIHALLGHNGAGKSTLLKILAGAQPPSSGTLSIGGQVIHLASPRQAHEEGIGCVYQELRLIPNLSVAQNLFLGREREANGFLEIKAMNDYTKKLLESYGLNLDPTQPVEDLNHPDKQLLEVIANLDVDVRFLFLDEPTTALDGQQAVELLQRVRKIAIERNIGVVLVSHKLDEVLAVCDEATVIAGGKVIYHEKGDAIKKEDIVKEIAGDAHHHEVEVLEIKVEYTEKVLEVRDLKSQRLNGIDLDAYKGEILGIYGLVGSGRTRFLRTIYGLEEIDSGEIKYKGQPYQPQSAEYSIQNKVAFLTEERKVDGFIPLMSAYQNVVLSTLRRYTVGGLIQLNNARNAAGNILSSVDTLGNLAQPVKLLSGGNQQKVLLSRIIVQNADLILLDEPTKGVDIGAKGDIYDIIAHLADEGRCIIVVSSEEEELMEICDRIAIFQHGKCTYPPQAKDEWTLARLRKAAWTHAA